jgi:hypothetical protein
MELEMEDGTVLEAPSAQAIAQALEKLDGKRNSFAILARDEMTYIQTSGSVKDGFDLEYQEGSTDRHFRAAGQGLTLQDVVGAFQDYAAGGLGWRSAVQWENSPIKKFGCLGVLLLAGAVPAIAAAVLR